MHVAASVSPDLTLLRLLHWNQVLEAKAAGDEAPPVEEAVEQARPLRVDSGQLKVVWPQLMNQLPCVRARSINRLLCIQA